MSVDASLVAAFVLGLTASGHCLAMCGGISGALALGAAREANARPRWPIVLAMQAGRIASYMLAAFALAGAGAALVHFVDIERVRIALRLLTAATFAMIALVLLGRMRGIDARIGRTVWPRLAPLARRLLPIRSVTQAFAVGAIWGWMPCGFVYSVLVLAWTSMDPLRSALTMLAFGAGTLPALFAGAFGTAAVVARLNRAGMRAGVGVALLVLAIATAGGPWAAAHLGLHGPSWLRLGCVEAP